MGEGARCGVGWVGRRKNPTPAVTWGWARLDSSLLMGTIEQIVVTVACLRGLRFVNNTRG